MNYDNSDIALLLQLGEDSHREFKQVQFKGDTLSGPSQKDLAHEIAAFANGGGGILLTGVADDGTVQGMSGTQAKELEHLVVEICRDKIKPPIDFRTIHQEYDGKLLLIVEVPEGYALHESSGHCYRRLGSSKRKMNSDEKARLAQQRGRGRFSAPDEQPVQQTGFGTLDESLWRPLLSAEGAKDPESALEKLALLVPDKAGDLRATVAGILLCTRNPEQFLPNAYVMATHYRGKDRASGQFDAQEITGPLNRQIYESVAFVMRNMRVAARKDPARVETPEYSSKAVFEAVVNAVVHRDYTMRHSKVRLSLFVDRLEIQSPGTLPNNLKLESMDQRQATRNEALASMLGRMQVDGTPGSEDRLYFMEHRGDGVPIINRETQALCGKRPVYQLIDDSEICLTLPAAPQEPSPAHAVVTVRCGNRPLGEVTVLALFPNKTWKQATTDEYGEAHLDLHSTELPMTVFAAAHKFAAYVEYDWIPSQCSLSLQMKEFPHGGSTIFAEATGTLPGLTGRLNPIRDNLDRTYLYASNISINEGQAQPVHFFSGDELRLTDANGSELLVRVIDIVGRSALIQYSLPTKA